MTRHERAISDDASALTALDTHHALLFGCPASDLRRPGWHLLVARLDDDPTAMLFGRRDLLRLVAPAAEAAAERASVVLVTEALRAPVAALLRTHPPAELLAPDGLAALDAVVRDNAGGEHAGGEHAAPTATHQQLRYTFSGAFQPYVGQWLEWIEPLDEAREMDPEALSLLARFSRGVYVIRQAGRIVAYAGLHQQSPHVWDLQAQTQPAALLRHGLGRAVISRATRAALAEDRLPLAAHTANDPAAAHVARALGYRLYGEMLVYSARYPAAPARGR